MKITKRKELEVNGSYQTNIKISLELLDICLVAAVVLLCISKGWITL
jgi:hypothetical protein